VYVLPKVRSPKWCEGPEGPDLGGGQTGSSLRTTLKIRLSRYGGSPSRSQGVTVKNCEVRVSPLGPVKTETPEYNIKPGMTSTEIIRCHQINQRNKR